MRGRGHGRQEQHHHNVEALILVVLLLSALSSSLKPEALLERAHAGGRDARRAAPRELMRVWCLRAAWN